MRLLASQALEKRLSRRTGILNRPKRNFLNKKRLRGPSHKKNAVSKKKTKKKKKKKKQNRSGQKEKEVTWGHLSQKTPKNLYKRERRSASLRRHKVIGV